jgi:hypothetical protein
MHLLSDFYPMLNVNSSHCGPLVAGRCPLRLMTLLPYALDWRPMANKLHEG